MKSNKNKTTQFILAGLLILTSPITYGLERYQVESGDQLWKIAEKYTPENAIVAQEVVAIFEANPRAFVYANINSLRQNINIEIPDKTTVLAIDKAYAVETIRKHFEDWSNGVREKKSNVTPIVSSQVTTDTQFNEIISEVESVKAEIQEVIKDLTVSQNVLDTNI